MDEIGVWGFWENGDSPRPLCPPVVRDVRDVRDDTGGDPRTKSAQFVARLFSSSHSQNRIAAQVDGYAGAVAALAANLQASDSTEARRDIWLGNFVEYTAAVLFAQGTWGATYRGGVGVGGGEHSIAATGSFLQSVEGCAYYFILNINK